MKILDLKTMPVFPYEERDKNVFYQTDTFKTRMVELPPGGEMPPCDMEWHVLFYVIKGKVTVSVNLEEHPLTEGQVLISEPGQYSMHSEEGVRLLGVQIATGEQDS